MVFTSVTERTKNGNYWLHCTVHSWVCSASTRGRFDVRRVRVLWSVFVAGVDHCLRWCDNSILHVVTRPIFDCVELGVPSHPVINHRHNAFDLNGHFTEEQLIKRFVWKPVGDRLNYTECASLHERNIWQLQRLLRFE